LRNPFRWCGQLHVLFGYFGIAIVKSDLSFAGLARSNIDMLLALSLAGKST
jgi:hypothetical protein